MRLPIKSLLAAVALAAALPGARADDSSATFAAGGLRFTRTNAIQMVSEDLFLSVDEVRIRYVFHNRTTRDVTLQVAFPLPDISPDYFYEPVSIPDPGAANFVRFETKVDGQPIPMQTDQRAILNGADVTARVRAAGLPLSPIAPNWSDVVARTAPATLADLTRRHLLELLDSGEKNQPAEYRALWSLRTAFYRTQTFPAGRDITVEQRYQPIAGGSVESLLLIDSIPRTNNDRRAYVRRYCIDDAFERAAQQTAQRFGGAEHVQERTLGYILTTGGHWAGPIGRFHLTIDKGAADNLVSLCAPDIHRTSPTRFELERLNFTPRSDLNILFLTPSRGE